MSLQGLTFDAHPKNDLNAIAVTGENLMLEGTTVESLSLDAIGNAQHFDVDLGATSGGATGKVKARMLASGDQWQIDTQSLTIADDRIGSWSLASNFAIELTPDHIKIEPACLLSLPARLCLGLEWFTAGQVGMVDLSANELPLDLVGVALQQTPFESSNVVLNLDAKFDNRPNAAEGPDLRLTAASSAGAIYFRDKQELQLSTASLNAEGDLGQVDLVAALSVDNIELSATGLWRDPLADGNLNVRLTGLVPDLAVYDSWLDVTSRLQGQVEFDLYASGSPAAPEIEGEFNLSNFATSLPDAGIALSDGSLEGHFDGKGTRFTARVTSGDGTARVKGDLDWSAGLAGSVAVSGDDVQLVQLPDLEVTGSPNVTLLLGEDGLNLIGRFVVPVARVGLDSFSTSVAPSEDVIVVDDEVTPEPDPWPFRSDLEIVLGDDVQLSGYGMDVSLSGRLRIDEEPGKPSRGTGRIDVSGNYAAFGQKLEITDGRLLFAADPLEDPAIDLRARRLVEEVEAGVTVSGRARSPTIDIYSKPAMTQSEALAYLVLGRPLNAVGSGDSDLLATAALGLGVAGSNRVLSRLAGGGGFASIGIADRQALGGTTFSMARYLSPKLYLSYSIGLERPVDLIELKYELSRRWLLQTEVGEETRGAIKYRIERGD